MGSTKLEWIQQILDYVKIGGSVASLVLPPGWQALLGTILATANNVGERVAEIDAATKATIEELGKQIEINAVQAIADIQKTKEWVKNDPRP